MGNQQYLLLVMTVIIVVIAIGIGISIYNFQSYSSNKRALISEMTTYPPNVMKYWNTAKILGGANMDFKLVSQASLAAAIGFTGSNYSNSSQNGEFRVSISALADSSATIRSHGREKRKGLVPRVKTTINLKSKVTNRLKTEIGDGDPANWTW
jgi:hypothetical protein